jgi:ligand-binding sensor domain-containing protein/tRNA A-37 threonylcarbamoyl transferase component Bud32
MQMNSSMIRVAFNFIVFLLLLTSFLLGLDPSKAVTQYNIDNWNDETGLPQNSVLSILQTRDGYLWLGTEEGLVRFDGVEFVVFDSDNTPEIINNRIDCLYEDHNQYLWIGTMGGGVVSHKNGIFKGFTQTQGLASLDIYDIHGDDSGNIWIGTDGGGLFRLSVKDNKITNYNDKKGLVGNEIKSIFSDGKGNLWVGTTMGLSRIKDEKIVNYNVGVKSGDKDSEVINVIYEDSRKNLWIGTIGALYRMEGESFIKYDINSDNTSVDVSSLYEDVNGNLWIATKNSGLARFRDGDFDVLGKQDIFANNWILDVTEDREGNLWVGTSYKGLFRIKDEKFTTLTRKEGLSDDIIFSIFQDSKGYIWIGTNSGLDRYKAGKISSFTTNQGLTHNTVDTITEDSSGAIWVGTDKGLNRLPNADSNRFRVNSYFKKLEDSYIPSILEDSSGALWVGTLRGAIHIKDRISTKYTDENGLATRFVNFIHEDRNGNTWISNLRGGVTMFKDGKFTQYSSKNGLSADSLNCIFEDADGVIWFGSNNGLTRLQEGKFFSITRKTGLFNNNIYQILEDDNRNLWMSTNKGIFRVSKSDLQDLSKGLIQRIKSIVYNKDDGMRSSECNGGYQRAGTRTKDGRLWFPTMKGVAIIDPARIKINKVLPPIHIQKILLDGDPVDINKPIVIPPGVKRLQLFYTALSFVNPQKVKFLTMLEGFDEEWLDSGTRRTTWYTNLDGGKYTFKVIACNNDSKWSRIGASINIVVISPYWKTWWFLIIAAVVFAFFSYGIIHFSQKYISLSAFWKKQKIIGKFKILDEIGSGGMGTIFKANNLMDKKETVALKVLREDLFKDEANRKRFKQEAAIIDQLDHPNIIKIYERGRSGQKLFIAMELLEGKTLAMKIAEKKKLGLVESVNIMVQVVGALAKIHSKNIIHRDLKPENIMLILKDGNANFVKLLDFGLARMQHQTRLTQTGTVIGTINYMSPEQITGQGAFPTSDIYALGIIFYEMITGDQPFFGDTTIDIMKQIIDKSPIEPIRFRFDISFELNHLIMRMLEKDRDLRPSVSEVLKQLHIIDRNIKTVETDVFNNK